MEVELMYIVFYNGGGGKRAFLRVLSIRGVVFYIQRPCVKG